MAPIMAPAMDTLSNVYQDMVFLRRRAADLGPVPNIVQSHDENEGATTEKQHKIVGISLLSIVGFIVVLSITMLACHFIKKRRQENKVFHRNFMRNQRILRTQEELARSYDGDPVALGGGRRGDDHHGERHHKEHRRGKSRRGEHGRGERHHKGRRVHSLELQPIPREQRSSDQ